MTALLLVAIEWGSAAAMVVATIAGVTGAPVFFVLAAAALATGLVARSLAGLAGRRQASGDRA